MANIDIYPILRDLADDIIERAQRNLGATRSVKTAGGKRRNRRADSTGIIYKCTDATAGAAVWAVYYDPNASAPLLLDTIRVGSTVGAGLTRYAAVGVAGASASIVLNIAPKRVHKDFRVVTGTTQSATGALTISRLFTTYAGATVQTDTLTIPANSPVGEYVFTGSTFDASAGFNMRFDIVQGTGTSAFIQGIENEYE